MFLRHVEIFVSDPMKSKDFYQNVLGFQVETIQKEKYVWMKMGEKEILLRPRNGPANTRQFHSSDSNIVLCSDDPVAELKRMKSVGLEVKGDDGGCPTSLILMETGFSLLGRTAHSRLGTYKTKRIK